MKSKNSDLADMAEQLKKKAKKGEVLHKSFTDYSIVGSHTIRHINSMILVCLWSSRPLSSSHILRPGLSVVAASSHISFCHVQAKGKSRMACRPCRTSWPAPVALLPQSLQRRSGLQPGIDQSFLPIARNPLFRFAVLPGPDVQRMPNKLIHILYKAM